MRKALSKIIKIIIHIAVILGLIYLGLLALMIGCSANMLLKETHEIFKYSILEILGFDATILIATIITCDIYNLIRYFSNNPTFIELFKRDKQYSIDLIKDLTSNVLTIPMTANLSIFLASSIEVQSNNLVWYIFGISLIIAPLVLMLKRMASV